MCRFLVYIFGRCNTYTVQRYDNYTLSPLCDSSVNGGTTPSAALWLLNFVVELDLNYMQRVKHVSCVHRFEYDM